MTRDRLIFRNALCIFHAIRQSINSRRTAGVEISPSSVISQQANQISAPPQSKLIMRPRETWKISDRPIITVDEELDLAALGIQPERLAILVGAGVSVNEPSCRPTAFQFLSAFYDVCLPESCDRNLFLSASFDLRFESVLGIVEQRFDNNLDILKLFSQGTSNHNHRCINVLAQQGALIITTNFDTLIESAGSQHSEYALRVEEQDFRDVIASKPMRSGLPEFWHLHGIVVDPRSKSNCSHTVVASIKNCWLSKDLFRLDRSKGQALRQALSERDLLVIGYSGSDDFDIAPALEEIQSERRVVWVHHSPRDPNRQVAVDYESILLAALTHKPITSDGITPLIASTLPDGTSWYQAPSANSLATMIGNGARLPDKVHLLRNDTALLLQQLSGIPNGAESSAGPNDGSDSRRDLAAYFLEWRQTHVPDELSRYLLATLLCRNGGLDDEHQRLLRESVKVHTQLRASPPSDLLRTSVEMTCILAEHLATDLNYDPELLFKNADQQFVARNPPIKASLMTTRGRMHHKAGRIDQAISCFMESLQIRYSASSRNDIEAAEYDFAQALFTKGYESNDLKEAERQGNKCLESSLSVPNPEGIARAYMLLARISERRDEIEEAKKVYQQACGAAYRSGNERLIAHSFGEFGLCLWSFMGSRNVKRKAELIAKVRDQFHERGLGDKPDWIEAMMGPMVELIQNQPLTFTEEDREECMQAARYLAEAFRIHNRQKDWAALKTIGSNLAECLEFLGEAERSLLSDCTVFRCAVFLKDQSTAQMSLDRIKAGAQRELPGIVFAAGNAQDFVTSVQKGLLDRDILI